VNIVGASLFASFNGNGSVWQIAAGVLFIISAALLIVLYCIGGFALLVRMRRSPSAALRTKSTRFGLFLLGSILSPVFLITAMSLVLVYFQETIDQVCAVLFISGFGCCWGSTITCIMLSVPVVKEVEATVSAHRDDGTSSTGSSAPKDESRTSSVTSGTADL